MAQRAELVTPGLTALALVGAAGSANGGGSSQLGWGVAVVGLALVQVGAKVLGSLLVNGEGSELLKSGVGFDTYPPPRNKPVR